MRTGHFNLRFSVGLAMFIERISGALATGLSLIACIALFGTPLAGQYQALLIISGLLALLLFRGHSISDLQFGFRFWSVVLSIVAKWLILFAVLLALGYATKTSAEFSRRVLFSWFIAAPTSIILVRFLVARLLERTTFAQSNLRRAVIAGANDIGASLANKIEANRQHSMDVLGFFDDRSGERLSEGSHAKILGRLSDLPDYVKNNKVDIIFVALPIRNVQRVTDLLSKLHDTTVSIYFAPDVFVFDLIQCRPLDVDGIPLVALCETPFYGTRGVVKRVSDIVIASSILLLVSPLMAVIAIMIKMSSPGSVIFKQRRYGLDGGDIVVYKFRSMTTSEDGDEFRQATKDDPRVTPIGRFLRKYSLDELPQFINVVQGRMSVVGPRPHPIKLNEQYRQLIKGYMIRHKVPPGITGLAQIRGHRGETSNLVDMQKRIESDLEYLRNWSLGLDLRIILKTILSVHSDEAAY